MGDIKGDRKNYSKYILMISAEKLAIIGLSELMKVIYIISGNIVIIYNDIPLTTYSFWSVF